MKFLLDRWKGDSSRLKIVPPVPQPDRRGVAVVVILRNEAHYLQDWLTFQALSGVDEVLLYDDGSTDDTVEIAKRFNRIPVTVTPWHMDVTVAGSDLKIAKQELAYAHAISTQGARFRWLAVIDSDEIIVPVEGETIGEALRPLEGHTNVSMQWVMFGHSGHDERPADPFPLAFNMRAGRHAGHLVNFKCIVDPCDVSLVRTHKFETRTYGTETVNDQGVVASDYKHRLRPEFLSNARLQLNHYFLRSRADFRRKLESSVLPIASMKKIIGHREDLARDIEAEPVEDLVTQEFLRRVGCGDAAAYRAFGAGD